MSPRHRRYHCRERYPQFEQSSEPLHWRTLPLPIPAGSQTTCLPFENGRSYGDACLNKGGLLLDARGLDRFMAFDPVKGVLRCESGVLSGEILDLIVPQGWFLPVVPGTWLVTMGGAIANDIHGKNHHSAGAFGCHVRSLELLRSDNRRFLCPPPRHTAVIKQKDIAYLPWFWSPVMRVIRGLPETIFKRLRL